MDSLSPRASATFVKEFSQHVNVHHAGIEKLVDEILGTRLSGGYFSFSKWSYMDLTPTTDCQLSVDWIFFTDLLNFSFWSDGNAKYEVSCDGLVFTGYWSLCAAVKRSINEGFDILNPAFYRTISEKQLQHVFRSVDGSCIPLFSERLQILRDAGETLMEKFNGSFINVIKMCDKSAVKLLHLLCQHFPSFRDMAIYKGKKISFLKRAQILVGDLWMCFKGKSYGEFYDIDEITAFADYRVPQVLAFLDVLSYGNDLLRKLQAGELIENGSEMEVEIRAATIYAIDLITQRLLEKMPAVDTTALPNYAKCNAILVDQLLWTFRRDFADEVDKKIPMHKTRCIYY